MEDAIKQEFDAMGVEPSMKVLNKSIELCIMYQIEDATEFVEQWIAFSLSNLSGAEPTIEHLNEFERKILSSNREKALTASKKKSNYSSASVNLVNMPNAPIEEAGALGIYGYEHNIMDEYNGGGKSLETQYAANVCQTPKSKNAPARHNDAIFSPASYSMIGTPRAHQAAPGSGKIIYTFGNPTLLENTQWKSTLQQVNIQVKQLLLHNGESLSAANIKYMFDNVLEKSEIIGDRIFNIGKSLCQSLFGADPLKYELHPVNLPAQDLVKILGTICSDCDNRLDVSSTLLISSDEASCRSVRLNFSRAQSYGIFPGQVVIVSGMNPRGDVMIVDKIFTERQLEPPAPPTLANRLSFVIASGPYTQHSDLVYDPMQDLLTYLKEQTPDVLILTGPFLEAENQIINEKITLAETFESFFEKMIAGIVDIVGPSTTIIIISSQKDVIAEPLYPTPPNILKKTYPNVHLLPDPSMIDLNGVVIGVTSTDIIDHILGQELATINTGDKIKRLVKYIFNQGSFYPLNPPPEEKMCIDSVLANHYAKIDKIPNILILPSDQKCFIKVVNECLTINPGRIADSNHGTFARFIITPTSNNDDHKIFNYVGCQIRKV